MCGIIPIKPLCFGRTQKQCISAHFSVGNPALVTSGGEHPVWSAGGSDQASAGEASQLARRQFDEGSGEAGGRLGRPPMICRFQEIKLTQDLMELFLHLGFGWGADATIVRGF